MSSRRRRVDDFQDDNATGGGMWIPGLGENRPRPREIGSVFGYVPDAFSNNLPKLPSESAREGSRIGSAGVVGRIRAEDAASTISNDSSTRSNSPRPDFGRRRPRTAADSSQMREALFQPDSGTDASARRPVVEETITCVDAGQIEATPFVDTSSWTSILIKGGTVVNEDVSEEADILIEDGLVKDVAKDIQQPQDCKIIDVKGKMIFPGGVDASVQLYNRKTANAELADGYMSGTRAALVGGTTCVVGLVMPDKDQSLVEAFKEWKANAEENSCCDFAFKVVIPKWSEEVKDEIGELVKKEGVNTFKVFLSEKEGRVLSDKELLEVLETCKSLGAVVEVHAENGEIIKENEKRLLARGITGPEGHLMARPGEVEEEAATRAIAFAKTVNVPLVIGGPTSKTTAEIIAKARKEGQAVFGNANVASLALDGSNFYDSNWTRAAAFVASPPLRDDSKMPDELLSSLVDDSGLHFVSSFNASYSTETKESTKEAKNFTRIPEGLNGIEDRMAVLWERGIESEHKMTPERFVSVTSSAAAKALNMYPKKGRIAAGSDADVVVWNRNNLREISARNHSQNVDVNVFEGFKVRGAPEFVISKGRMVVYEYQANISSGKGEFLELNPYPKTLYDAVEAFAKSQEQEKVERDEKAKESNNPPPSSNPSDFGVTTPRRSLMEEPIMNKKLGIYQRPMSAHGIRNQQDSTFSLSGGYNEDVRRASVKVNAPPGGEGRAFW